MKKRKFMFKMLRCPACLWLVWMAAGGGVSIVISNTWDRPFYLEVPVTEVPAEKEKKGIFLQARAICEAFVSENQEGGSQNQAVLAKEGDNALQVEKEAMIEQADRPQRLNSAFYYDEGMAAGGASESYAGKVYGALLKEDASWMSGIYGLRYVPPKDMAARLGKEESSVMGTRHLNGVPLEGEGNTQVIPSWNRFKVSFHNGDGTPVMGHSNIKEILSLASVYAYFHQEQSYDFLLSYADKLWKSSHSYKISVSDVYYCQGECLYSDRGDEDREDAQETNGGLGQAGLTQEEIDFSGSGGVTWLAENVDASQGAGTDGEPSGEGQGTPDPPGTGQVSHEPIPAAQPTGETAGQGTGQGGLQGDPAGQEPPLETQPTSHEPVPVPQPTDGASGQETGQGVFEGDPAGQEPPLETQPTSHEPVPADQPTDGTSGQETGQGVLQEAPAGQEELPRETQQISHEPVPAAQPTGETSVALASGETANQETGVGSGDPVLSAQPVGGPTEETQPAPEGTGTASQTLAESGQAPRISGEKGSKYCQGHIDLNISATIIGIDENRSLFTQSTAFAEDEPSGSWNGWDDFARNCARIIVQQDWYAEYGLTGQDTMFVHNPLSGSEVARYMDLLPADTSQKRRKMARQALLSIGCIPYYWGGKPSCGGFEGNGFGTVVSPDEDGRILKGLDCSGWINWVYWTAFGSSLPAESTSGLMGCGRAVEKKDLQAGDILIRAGKQPHVYLFLAWAPDGSMYLIHETTGNVNNVTINTYDLDLPYYRCIINEE